MAKSHYESRIAVFMFTDIAGSTAMKHRLGATQYAPLCDLHNATFRAILKTVPGAIELENPGDGFLARFPTASSAVEVALRFQYALQVGPWEGERFGVRIGLHMGEVVEIDVSGHEPEKFVGTPLDLAARVESLAMPGQILMTRSIFDDGRLYVREHPEMGDGSEHALIWMAHGGYLFKGADEPIDVFEVGADGIAPLAEPPDSEKARRAVVAGDEVLGWRPASGLEVPGRTRWALDRKIGEGAFGEVWVARHKKMKTERVFKFCHDIDRVSSFKREMTLFRLLQTVLGDRPDIVRIYDVKLDEPPYYLESEYARAGDLTAWAESRGGLGELPLETRLEFVARTADAVAAAHSVGILHKDIKPANILVHEDDDGVPTPRLADFGISAIADPSRLERANITMTGFGEDFESDSTTGISGTRVYMAPEVLAGDAFTTRGDVYALGVLLYQVVTGDLKRALAPGWEADVDDVLLREDIAGAAEGHRDDRLPSADELARRLRSMDQRRRARRRRKMAKVATAAAVLLTVLGAIVGLMLIRESGLRREAEQQAAIANAVNSFLNKDLLSVVAPSFQHAKGRNVRMREVLDVAAKRIDAAAAAGGEFADKPLVEASIRATLGNTYSQLGEYDAAATHMERARSLHTQCVGAEHPKTLRSNRRVAILYHRQGNYPEASLLLLETLATSERVYGPEHSATLDTLIDLAMLTKDEGNYDEAETHLQRALEVRQRTLGDEDPATLACTDALAGLYLQQGRYADAEPLYTTTLERRMAVLGEDHLDTLTTMSNLATLYFRGLSRVDDAEALYIKLLTVARRVLGENHPDTMFVTGNLATLYGEQGRYAEAEPLAVEVLETSRRILGDEHPFTLMTMSNVAGLYAALERREEAVTLRRQVLETSERVLGPEHPDTLLAMNDLAYLYCAERRFADARPLAVQAAETQRRTTGEAHEDTLSAEDTLAVVLIGLHEYQQAERILRRIVTVSTERYGADHWLLPFAQAHLGACLVEMKRYEDAETQLLAAYPHLEPYQDSDTALALEYLVKLYEEWGKPDLAAPWIAKARGGAEPG